MANTGTTGFMEIVNSNIYIPFSTASNYDMILRTDQIQQRMFIGNGSNSSNMPALILSTNNVSINNPISTYGTPNKIWDFSGTISDTSLKPGPIGQNFISGSNISVSLNNPFSNINTEGSIYLPGITGNYITLPQPTTSALTDTTIEAWYYQVQTPVNAYVNIPYLIGNMTSLNAFCYWSFGINTTNQLTFFSNGSGGFIYVVASSTTFSNNNWNHIAFCYSNAGKSAQLYINGTVQTLTVTGTGTTGNDTTTVVYPSGVSNNSVPLSIGQYNNVSLNANVANLRWTNSVLYTSSFTPSSYPLQIWGSNNTQLLLRAPLYNPIEHINSIQTYDSLRAHCLPSDAMIYADCYGTNLPNLSSNVPLFDSNISQSIIFNRATSQYISFAPQTFNVATKGFTCITKFMFTSNISSYERIFEFGNGIGNNNILMLRNSTTNNLMFYVYNGANGNTMVIPPFTFNQNIVYTIACKYDPYTNNNKTNFFGNMSLFVNGSNISNSNMGLTIGSDRVLNNVYIGNNEWGNSQTINGNIYNLAVYNRALTDKEIIDASAALNSSPSLPNQSTVEIGSVSGKPALTVKNDGTLQIAGPINATNNQSYYPVDYGNCNLSISGGIIGNVPAVATSPFNTTTEGSLYITTSNYITIPNTVFSTSWWLNGGFTCESWVNYPSFTNVAISSLPNIPLTMGFINSNQLTWSVGPNQSSNLTFYYFNGGLNYVIGSNPMQTNTWYHIAVTYDLTSIRIFQNGILQNSAALSGTPITVTNRFTIGGMYGNDPGVANMNVTNTRLILGTALYTANFTPPTGPLSPSSSGTTALLLRVPQNPGRVLIPKIGGTTKVQVYPPVLMTDTYMNIQNTLYGTGKYIITTSYNGVTGANYLPFSGIGTRWTCFGWQTSVLNASYLGSTQTIDIYGNAYMGEWIQIQLPVSINVSSMYINSFAANLIYILGSVDGNNWTLIKQQNLYGGALIFQLNTSLSFNYFRIIINSAYNTNVNGTTGFYSIIFYGTQESINITPDGQVGIGITQPVQSLEVAGNSIINGNISAGNLGMFRNRIINGDMRINQRGVTSSTSTGYIIDRWSLNAAINTGQLTQSVVTLGTSDIPYQYGCRYSWKIQATTACSSYSYIQPTQQIEGYNIADFRWGTPYGSPITISFWVRTNIANNNLISFSIRNTNTINIPINITNSGGWQYVNRTLPPPLNGYTWPSGSNAVFDFMIGALWLQSSATSNVWTTNSRIGIAGAIDPWATLNNYIEFTGVQLEKGTIVTPFEFRPYAIELQLCQRYFFGINTTNGYVGIVYGDSSSTDANTKSVLIINLPQTMRIPPTFYNNNAVVNYDMISYQGGALSGLTNLTVATTNNLGVLSSSTSLTQGYCLAAVLISGNMGFNADF